MKNNPEIPDGIPNPEAERAELKAKLDEFTNGKHPILVEALSYFPNKAEEFIRIQQYAHEINPRPGTIWFAVSHQKKEKGFHGTEYIQGQVEDLTSAGYLAKGPLKLIKVINSLREGRRDESHYFLPDKWHVEKILSYIRSRGEKSDQKLDKETNEETQIEQKTLELMQITDKEIKLLQEYLDKGGEAKRKEEKAYQLRKEADQLMEEAGVIYQSIQALSSAENQ